MMLRLHPRATPPPRIRRAIQSDGASARALAARYGISVGTVLKWRGRDDVADRSHRPRCVRSSLNAVEEQAAVELRRTLGLSLDDIVAAMRAGVRMGICRAARFIGR